jgi:hypothetical protein
LIYDIYNIHISLSEFKRKERDLGDNFKTLSYF